MKSIVKTAAALTMLLTFTGCWDFGWSKKDKQNEKSETGYQGKKHEKNGKTCSNKNCSEHHKHHDDVKTQEWDEEEGGMGAMIQYADEDEEDLY
jgi:hypothetical protein